jgi:SAM-dependent methyltransferase
MRHRRQPTRNRTGWTSNVLNELSELFVAHAATVQRPVLDIGAAYGVATLPALAAGATVYANDADPTHLAALDAATPPAHRPRLRLLPGRFPQDLDLPPGSLDAVHASNVLHFLTGDELTAGIADIRRWLAPGGRLFIQAGTPYQQPFQAFIPIYEERVRTGVPWPGWIEDTRAISTHKKLGQIPRSLHLLDEQVLTNLLTTAGLAVEHSWTYCRRDLPRSMHLNGREGVGCIASSYTE